MSRKRIHPEAVLSGAEKQKRHREKIKAKLAKIKALEAAPPSPADTAPDMAALREQVKKELREAWEPELKAERIAAERKEGRRLARQKDKTHEHARIEGICSAADFFIGKDRADIARALLSHFYIDREKAAAVLEADKRTKSLTLASLDAGGAWGKPPRTIK